jgi:hypothetical protein
MICCRRPVNHLLRPCACLNCRFIGELEERNGSDR